MILIYEYMDIDGQLFSMCYDTNINHGLHSTYSLHIDRQTDTNKHTHQDEWLRQGEISTSQ